MKKQLFFWSALIAIVALATSVFANEVRLLTAYIVQFRVLVDGVEQRFEDPIVVINDRSYIPLRAVSEALGMDVEWCGENQQISIISNPPDMPPMLSKRPESAQALYGDDTLYRFEKNGLWGLMDADGNTLVEPQYLLISRSYSEGLVAVRGVSGDAEHWGFIDREGSLIISLPGIFGVERGFSEGFALIFKRPWGLGEIPNVIDLPGPFVFINREGQNVFGQEFEIASSFNDGLAAVRPYNGKSIFIDATGQNAFNMEFALASNFEEGYAWVTLLDGTTAYIDREGNIVDRPSR